MLIAILMLYFSSDLTDPLLLPHLERCHLSEAAQALADAGMKQRLANDPAVVVQPVHTFNIIALQQIGQHTAQLDDFGIDQVSGRPLLFLGHGLQWWRSEERRVGKECRSGRAREYG